MENFSHAPLLLRGLLLASLGLQAGFGVAQEDSDFSIDPVMTYFGAVALGSTSDVSSIFFTNTNAFNSLAIQGVAQLSGEEASQFEIVDDGCVGKTLTPGAPGGSCELKLRFTPNSFGSKMAMVSLDINDTESPKMVAFVSSEEDNPAQAERRLPAVIYGLNLPASLNASVSTTLAWSVLGYHDSYNSTLALFDCTGKVVGECGANFAESFWSSGVLAPVSSSIEPDWRYFGENAMVFNYSAVITAADYASLASGTSNIVARFYNKSLADTASQESSLTLVIPGNLNVTYYGAQGRRISLTVVK